MKSFKTLVIFVLVLATTLVQAQLTPKQQSVQDLRKHFSKNEYRGHQLSKGKVEKITPEECVKLLNNNGQFTDLIDQQNEIENKKLNLSKHTESQVFVGKFLQIAFNRMWRIAKTYREKPNTTYKKDETLPKLFKAINNYSKIEADRGSNTTGRFHISCFAIPTAAVNTYFGLFGAMEDIEKGIIKDAVAIQANNSLKEMSYQSWTQPYRNDETDKNPVSVERFRNHVWWVGGNGLGYRSLLPTAAAMSSVEMMDVLSVVAKGGLSNVSQNTYDDAFWTEGFTADGAGWGHGMQCLVWGYPISGTSAALSLLDEFKGTPWAKQLDQENAQSLINYFRGSSWYYYKGFTPPSLSRANMEYTGLKPEFIKTDKMIKSTINDWFSSYSAEEQQELKDLKADIKDKQISMQAYQDGYYTGTRWFFNNDNLIKKNPDYYMSVSMASIRCDGIESAHTMADKYNFFTCDGMTFFMKDGNEYHKAIGAWNLTAVPGVTSRQGEDKLVPVTNWRGYCSKHNFAAAATSGGKNAASGFIFEKMNASDKKNVNDPIGKTDPNTTIYGIKANKAYFMVDDYMIALGAGINNLNPQMEGDIWTTLDQTHYNNTLQFYSEEKQTNVTGNIALQLTGNDLVWASQKDGFSYAVLPKYTMGKVFLLTEKRKTKWEAINESNKKHKNLPEEESIFQMYINHGKNVENGHYAYVVYGGKESSDKAFKAIPLNIIENSVDLQAISWGDDYLGASFYNPNKILKTKETQVKVSAPCALLLEKMDGYYKLSITDAEMNKNLKTITVKTTLPIEGDYVMKDGIWNIISVPMPQGKLCGKPAVVEISIK
ncbi:polysaccharide lyase family 8 super-sandwich domain-containing protein [Mariniflexile ostreae]|uniref:Polysaccharide lyase family 8 super-sandwich domain-containing protein n=1 Tax=Mariniflexile ostreae TaxID=1520892 RepID=A0ABV5FF63_9FLAO